MAPKATEKVNSGGGHGKKPKHHRSALTGDGWASNSPSADASMFKPGSSNSDGEMASRWPLGHEISDQDVESEVNNLIKDMEKEIDDVAMDLANREKEVERREKEVQQLIETYKKEKMTLIMADMTYQDLLQENERLKEKEEKLAGTLKNYGLDWVLREIMGDT
ncbi:hypothetical protein MFIFM68171_09835 [Madurella fahalii]|uniref:Uncharacterized protein n=1 Tax=Madurella fahalii TaxID=1157608 RepID=A0ABQ0GPF9_9PEZI